jgi:hypothetical protein
LTCEGWEAISQHSRPNTLVAVAGIACVKAESGIKPPETGKRTLPLVYIRSTNASKASQKSPTHCLPRHHRDLSHIRLSDAICLLAHQNACKCVHKKPAAHARDYVTSDPVTNTTGCGICSSYRGRRSGRNETARPRAAPNLYGESTIGSLNTTKHIQTSKPRRHWPGPWDRQREGGWDREGRKGLEKY